MTKANKKRQDSITLGKPLRRKSSARRDLQI